MSDWDEFSRLIQQFDRELKTMESPQTVPRHPLADFVKGWVPDRGISRRLTKLETEVAASGQEHHWSRSMSDLQYTPFSELIGQRRWRGRWITRLGKSRFNFKKIAESYGVYQGPVRLIGAEEISRKIDQQLNDLEGEAERRVQAEIDGAPWSNPCATHKEMEDWEREVMEWRRWHDPDFRSSRWQWR